jgi:hypothetical protein
MKWILSFAMCVAISASSWAASYTCAGNVVGVSIDPKTGQLLAEKIGPLEWPRLCRVNADYNGVSAETCKTIYSTLLAAQMSGKQVVLWFNDGLNCSTESHTPWHTLTGWYFGPKLAD